MGKGNKSMPIFPPRSTAAKCLQYAEGFGLIYEGEKEGGHAFRSNTPWRDNSESHALYIKIDDDLGEKGTWKDWRSEEVGSLYDLYERFFGSRPERKSESDKAAANTIRLYETLDDYAQDHGVPGAVFERWRWTLGMHWCRTNQRERPAFLFETHTGPRARFRDGLKPKYSHGKGYKRSWYGLKSAVKIAIDNNLPIFITNGEPSVIVGQYFGIPVCCVTGGSENKDLPQEFVDDLKLQYPQGSIGVLLDSDEKGRASAPALAAFFRKHGWANSRPIDLGFADGFDLADFSRLYEGQAITEIMRRYDLGSSQPGSVSSINVEDEGEAIRPILSPLDAEKALLAHLLSDPRQMADLPETFTAQWFSVARHGILLHAIKNILARGGEVTPITVYEFLRQRGESEKVGGLEGIHFIRDSHEPGTKITTYFAFVEEAQTRRKLIEAGAKMQVLARDPDKSLEDIKLETQSSVSAAFIPKQGNGAVSISEGVNEIMALVNGDIAPAIETGFSAYDTIAGGLAEGALTLIAGRPGGGKTAFITHTLYNVLRRGIPAIFFSMELSVRDVTARLISTALADDITRWNLKEQFGGNIVPTSFSDILRGRMGNDNVHSVISAASIIDSLPLTVLARRVSLNDVVMETQRHAANIGQRTLVFIDFVQLMAVNKEKRNDGVGENIYGLKSLAQNVDTVLGLAVVSQMNRAIESRGRSGEPNLSDLEDSGKIEQAADTVMFLIPPEEKEGEDDATVGNFEDGGIEITAIVKKNRNGPKGRFTIEYKQAFNYFVDNSYKSIEGY